MTDDRPRSHLVSPTSLPAPRRPGRRATPTASSAECATPAGSHRSSGEREPVDRMAASIEERVRRRFDRVVVERTADGVPTVLAELRRQRAADESSSTRTTTSAGGRPRVLGQRPLRGRLARRRRVRPWDVRRQGRASPRAYSARLLARRERQQPLSRSSGSYEEALRRSAARSPRGAQPGVPTGSLRPTASGRRPCSATTSGPR